MRGVKENEIRRHRQYLHAINQTRVLTRQEEVELFHRWHEDQDHGARDKIIQAHLRLVPSIARRTADQFGYRPQAGEPQEAWDGYWNVQRELVSAGNEGLFLALDRFDPSRGVRFAACARFSIKKACHEKAKWLLGTVKHPKRQETPPSISFDEHLVEHGESPAARLNLLTNFERENLAVLGGMLQKRVATLDDPRERRILRARCLTNSPLKLRELAQELGVSSGRIHQIEQRAVRSIGKLLPQSSFEELVLFYANNSAPASSQIDDWLDNVKALFPWATQSDRIKAHHMADRLRAGASDFNLNRANAALREGLTVAETAETLGLSMEAVEHLRQLVDWRHGLETRYTLTAAGLEMIKVGTDIRDAA